MPSKIRIFTVLTLALALFTFVQCNQQATEADIPPTGQTVSSPDGQIQVIFTRDENGTPYYQIRYAGREVIKPSKLGFVFKDAEPLNQNLTIVDSVSSSFDETWTQPWGEVKDIRNHYHQLRLELQEAGPLQRELNLVFRVYDDGLGFRYEFPAQPNLKDFQIMDEQTEFALAGDHRAWWIPAYEPRRYEQLYWHTPVNEMPTVHTPLTMQTTDNLFLSIHEAALTDYASMTLAGKGNNILKADLVPWSDGVKVKAATPHQTPWRTIQIAESAGDLLTSYLILNLNEPNQLGDVSWVKPGKYVGIWWCMHIRTCTWGRGPRHGAKTENVKRYIDFAAAHGFDGVLVEGWNYGWDEKWWQDGSGFDFTRPYADFDIEEIARYAAEKGIRLIGHHETGGAIDNYERQVDDAFALYQSLGVDTVKTGYANMRVNETEWHHGQFMVQHYRRVLEKAAAHKIMLNVHEPIKDTGLRRTYPNMMTREGARGQEYNAWSTDGGNPPEHTTILPFTRMLSGPFDFTPGIFDLLFEEARPSNRVNTTLAKQLALYVVIYSPLHMAADLPENYEDHPAFKFIKDVPVDWQDTQVLHAQIGDYVTMARQDRNSQAWYIGSITDEEGRVLNTPLTFLNPKQTYVAEIHPDAIETDWESDPLVIDISEVLVDNSITLKIELAPGGGQAIRLRPATETDVRRIPPYQ